MDDTALVAAAQNGDRQALRQLLANHQPGIYALARRMLGNDTDAYDVTQEALIAIVKGLPSFNRQSRFSTWVYRVTANAALDEIRRSNRRPTPVEFVEESLSGTSLPRDSAALNPYTALDDRLSIDVAIQQIHHNFAVAVVLRDQLGFEYAEIANILEVPIGTVRSRIARGRRDLARLLKNTGETDSNGN